MEQEKESQEEHRDPYLQAVERERMIFLAAILSQRSLVNAFRCEPLTQFAKTFAVSSLEEHSMRVVDESLDTGFGVYRTMRKEAEELKKLLAVYGKSFSERDRNELADIAKMVFKVDSEIKSLHRLSWFPIFRRPPKWTMTTVGNLLILGTIVFGEAKPTKEQEQFLVKLLLEEV